MACKNLIKQCSILKKNMGYIFSLRYLEICLLAAFLSCFFLSFFWEEKWHWGMANHLLFLAFVVFFISIGLVLFLMFISVWLGKVHFG